MSFIVSSAKGDANDFSAVMWLPLLISYKCLWWELISSVSNRSIWLPFLCSVLCTRFGAIWMICTLITTEFQETDNCYPLFIVERTKNEFVSRFTNSNFQRQLTLALMMKSGLFQRDTTLRKEVPGLMVVNEDKGHPIERSYGHIVPSSDQSV